MSNDFLILIFCIFSLVIIGIFNTKWWKNLETRQKIEREKEDYRNEVRTFLSAYSRFIARKKRE